jgi:hypothetical protein
MLEVGDLVPGRPKCDPYILIIILKNFFKSLIANFYLNLCLLFSKIEFIFYFKISLVETVDNFVDNLFSTCLGHILFTFIILLFFMKTNFIILSFFYGNL